MFESIGARIKSLRKSRGLSQAELGRRSGLGRERLSTLECGARTPTPGQLERIAAGLGVPVTALVQRTDWLSPEQRAHVQRQSAAVWQEYARENTWRPPFDRDMSTQLRKAVGNLLVPAYRVDLGGLPCLLIPQVGMACRKCTWCVDFLVGVIGPRGVVRWLYVEIDGDGHDDGSNPFREEDIDMPIVRLCESEVIGEGLLPLLASRIRETLHLAA